MKGSLSEAHDILNAWKSMIHVADQTYQQYELLSYRVRDIEEDFDTAVNNC